MKDANDTLGNRTRDLPACGAVPEPTAPAGAPTLTIRLPNPGHNINLHRHKGLNYYTLFCVNLQYSYKVRNRGRAVVKRLETLACRHSPADIGLQT
jgi:hypothetical protein